MFIFHVSLRGQQGEGAWSVVILVAACQDHEPRGGGGGGVRHPGGGAAAAQDRDGRARLHPRHVRQRPAGPARGQPGEHTAAGRQRLSHRANHLLR